MPGVAPPVFKLIARYLANHFVHVYARKENKAITGVAEHVIQTMVNYDWPGNIRELENIMARSVLLTNDPIVNSLKLSGQPYRPAERALGRIKTMIESERDHILAALERSNCKIYGQGGAAELLDLNPSTLNSRIKNLGLEKKYFRTGDN